MRRNSYLGLAMASLGSLFATAALGSLFATGAPINLASPPRDVFLVPAMPVVSKPVRRLNRTTLHGRNGKREVALRLRQVAAGQLTRSNGLVSADELFGFSESA